MVDIGRIGIVGGGGWLGTAIARALLGAANLGVNSLTCSYRSKKSDDAATILWTKDNADLVERSDVVILSVRPNDWKQLELRAPGKLVISVMAGVAVADIAARTGATRIARALPNAAAEIGCSYTPYFLAPDAASDRDTVAAIFAACGAVDQVADEDQIDYFTALSGSGAAFPALLAEAMMLDAIGRGVPADIARRAAQRTLVGAGRLQEFNGISPTDTVKSFVDYNGTTAAGIVSMRNSGFAAIVGAGLQAAYLKAKDLAKDEAARQ